MKSQNRDALDSLACKSKGDSMAKKEFKRIIRPATAQERARHRMRSRCAIVKRESRSTGTRLSSGIGGRKGVRTVRCRLLLDRNLVDPLGVGRVSYQDFRQNVSVERFHSRTSASRS